MSTAKMTNIRYVGPILSHQGPRSTPNDPKPVLNTYRGCWLSNARTYVEIGPITKEEFWFNYVDRFGHFLLYNSLWADRNEQTVDMTNLALVRGPYKFPGTSFRVCDTSASLFGVFWATFSTKNREYRVVHYLTVNSLSVPTPIFSSASCTR